MKKKKKLDEYKLALAVIQYISDNMIVIKNTDVDKHIDELSTFSMEFSSDEKTSYGRNFNIPVSRFRKIKKEKFLKVIKHFMYKRVYLVNTNYKETVLFADDPLPTETSVNDYLAKIKYTKKGISRVQLEIYHNAADRNLTYDCTIINFNLDYRSLIEIYDNIDHSKHNSPYIHKDNFEFF